MVKEIANEARTEIQKRQVMTVELYQFHLEGESHYWTTNNQDLTYDGQLYRAWGENLSRTPITYDLEGTIGDMTLTAANVNGELGRIILDRDLSGASFVLLKAFANHLENAQAWMIFEGSIDEAAISEAAVVLKVRSRNTGLERFLPRRTYGRYCPWIFKQSVCGYTGEETECVKTLASCIALGNKERFGGFDLYVTPA